MEYKKATFNLAEELHHQLKVTAALQRREMVDLVRDALTAYLGWNRMTDIEQQERRTYELADSQGRGQRAHIVFTRLTQELGGNQAIAAQLLHHVHKQGLLMVDVWDGSTYRPLHMFGDTSCLYQHGGELHLQLTIPGRTRYELLQQRHAWETTHAA